MLFDTGSNALLDLCGLLSFHGQFGALYKGLGGNNLCFLPSLESRWVSTSELV